MGEHRIELGDLQPGAFAMIRSDVPWGLMREAGGLTERDWGAFVTAALRRMVRSWQVRGPGGQALPLPKDLTDEQIDDLDGRIVTRIVNRVREIMEASAPAPNSPSA